MVKSGITSLLWNQGNYWPITFYFLLNINIIVCGIILCLHNVGLEVFFLQKHRLCKQIIKPFCIIDIYIMFLSRW